MLGPGPCGPLLGGAEVERPTYFDELHIQLGILLHVLKQVSVECLHLGGAQAGVTRMPFDPAPNGFTFYYHHIPNTPGLGPQAIEKGKIARRGGAPV